LFNLIQDFRFERKFLRRQKRFQSPKKDGKRKSHPLQKASAGLSTEHKLIMSTKRSASLLFTIRDANPKSFSLFFLNVEQNSRAYVLRPAATRL
jgi:hypothetical protein